MNSFNKWFETFLEEKQLPSADFEIEYNGETHFLDTDVVIEAIQNCSKAEQAGIKNILVKLDFANAKPAAFIDFFKHLAKGLVSQY